MDWQFYKKMPYDRLPKKVCFGERHEALSMWAVGTLQRHTESIPERFQLSPGCTGINKMALFYHRRLKFFLTIIYKQDKGTINIGI